MRRARASSGGTSPHAPPGFIPDSPAVSEGEEDEADGSSPLKGIQLASSSEEESEEEEESE